MQNTEDANVSLILGNQRDVPFTNHLFKYKVLILFLVVARLGFVLIEH